MRFFRSASRRPWAILLGILQCRSWGGKIRGISSPHSSEAFFGDASVFSKILSEGVGSTALTAENGLISAVFACCLTMEGTISVRAFTSPTVDVPLGPVVVVVRVSDVCPVSGEGLESPTLLFEAEHVVAHSRC